jgi:hypothetical protein
MDSKKLKEKKKWNKQQYIGYMNNY